MVEIERESLCFFSLSIPSSSMASSSNSAPLKALILVGGTHGIHCVLAKCHHRRVKESRQTSRCPRSGLQEPAALVLRLGGMSLSIVLHDTPSRAALASVLEAKNKLALLKCVFKKREP